MIVNVVTTNKTLQELLQDAGKLELVNKITGASSYDILIANDTGQNVYVEIGEPSSSTSSVAIADGSTFSLSVYDLSLVNLSADAAVSLKILIS